MLLNTKHRLVPSLGIKFGSVDLFAIVHSKLEGRFATGDYGPKPFGCELTRGNIRTFPAAAETKNTRLEPGLTESDGVFGRSLALRGGEGCCASG